MSGTRSRLGMLFFIASEGVFFLLLVLAYVVYHRGRGSGPTAASTLNVGRTGLYSVALLASSATMAVAGRGARRGARGRFVVGLAATLALGLAFLVGQCLEYAQLLREDVTISRNLFGSTFFTLTGFHGMHVALGLVMIATLLGLATRGWERVRPGAVEAVSIYWHFVDVVWVVIFGIVYLWNVL